MVKRSYRKKTKRQKLDKTLWDLMSEYVRRRDATVTGYVRCITCGNIRHWTKVDMGHGIPCQHQSTRFDEKNIHAQCKPCNGPGQGEQAKYAAAVDEKYGEGTWDGLVQKRHQACKRTEFDLEYMIGETKEKVAELNAKNHAPRLIQ